MPQYYVKLISNGTFDVMNTSGLPNNFPQDNEELKSPYGPIWFEWPDHLQPTMVWENAVQQEMTILCDLVLSGWVNLHRQATPDPLEELNRRLSTVTMGHESARSENPSPFNLRNLRIEDVAPFRPSNAPSENTSPFNLRNLSIEDVSPFRPSNARIEDVSPFSSRNTRTEDLSPLNSGNACPMIPLQGRRSHAEIYATPSRRAGEIERRVLEPIADAPNDHGSPVEHPPFPRYCRGRGFRGVRAGHGGFGGNGARGGFGHRNTVSYS